MKDKEKLQYLLMLIMLQQKRLIKCCLSLLVMVWSISGKLMGTGKIKT